MPKLKDIAEHVGVSISTVSRVINNDVSRHVSAETKSKIWKAIKEMGYELKKAPESDAEEQEPAIQTRQIGCIISVQQNKFNDPYFSPILEGIEAKLLEFNYSLTDILTQDKIQDESTMNDLIKKRKLDGIVIVEGITTELHDYIKKVVPAIVGIDISDPSVPVITYDRVDAVKEAVRHLIDQGHRKIGFIGGTGLAGDMRREKRFRGYKEALEDEGLSVVSKWVLNAEWDFDASYNSMSELLKRDRDEWPTAMFAASDMMAISAMRAVSEKGLRIPEDIAFVGLDNIEVSKYTSPPLSTIHIPKFEIGTMAAKVLVEQINGGNPLPFKMVMPFELLVRQSSKYDRS